MSDLMPICAHAHWGFGLGPMRRTEACGGNELPLSLWTERTTGHPELTYLPTAGDRFTAAYHGSPSRLRMA